MKIDVTTTLTHNSLKPPLDLALPEETFIHPVAGISEPLGSLSHLLGAVVFLWMTRSLLRRGGGDRRRIAWLAAFAFACVFQLAISGVYHWVDPARTAHTVLRRIDHAAIFLLIAATFTPIHGILFKGGWRWGMLLFIWTASAAGIVLNSVFLERAPPWLPPTLYVALGWVGLLSAIKLVQRHGYRFIAPLFYGGMAYSLGAGCLGLMALAGGVQLIPGVAGRHELFHFAVLIGIGFHWKFVSSFASQSPPLRNR